MSWFFIALIAPFLWSISNYIDKYLLTRFLKRGGVGALMIFSSLVVLFIYPIFLVIEPDVINIPIFQALTLILGGLIGALAILLYLIALNDDEASVVAPFFQLIPVFLYIFGYLFLKETLNSNQILAGFLIIIGAVILSIEIKKGGRYCFKKKLVFLMVLSSILVALYETMFKFVAIEEGFWISNFWQYTGLLIFGIILLIFFKNYREEFVNMIKDNGVKILGLNLANEILYISANLILFFAYLLAPIVLVGLVNSYQPFFVFIIGVILALFFPEISEEKMERKYLIQKILAILIVFIGSVLLYL